MKKLLLLLALLIAVAFLCWKQSSRGNRIVFLTNDATTTVPLAEALPLHPQSNVQPSVLETDTSMAPTAIVQRIAKELLPKMREASWEWKVPIEFYGKVLDQRGEPVPEAHIHFSWNDLSSKGTSHADNESDDAGLFSLVGKTGKALSVSVSKGGYYSSKRDSGSFEFAIKEDPGFYRPDSANPVVFHLRRKGEEILPVKRLKVEAPVNGASVQIDLMQSKVTSEGEVQIQTWKPTKDRVTGRSDWAVRLSAPSGGFIDTTDEYPFVAPENGYSSTIEFRFPLSMGEEWRGFLRKKFYVAFGNPRKYAVIHFETSASGRNCNFDYVVNPSGSRNLEHEITYYPIP